MTRPTSTSTKQNVTMSLQGLTLLICSTLGPAAWDMKSELVELKARVNTLIESHSHRMDSLERRVDALEQRLSARRQVAPDPELE